MTKIIDAAGPTIVHLPNSSYKQRTSVNKIRSLKFANAFCAAKFAGRPQLLSRCRGRWY